MAEDRIKVVPPNESPEAGIAEAEKRFGARTKVRNLRPIVTVQEGDIPLNGRCKIGIISGVSASQGTVGDLKIDLRMLSHPPKKRGHVLNGVRTNGEYPVSGFRHVLPGKVERLAHITLCGLKAPNRKPLYIPPSAGVAVPCQKLEIRTGTYLSLC